MKSKIYITGAAGFIGFHTTKKLLNKGIEVHGFDSMNNYYDIKLKKARLNILKDFKKFSFTKAKLENKKSLERIFNRFKPKVVIHLAAQAGVRYSIDKPRVYLESNITGSYNIIEVSKKYNVVHLIMASSSSVYGANTKIPFKEIDKTETQLSIYASTKKSNESLAHSYSNIWKIPITMLRFFTVYGPWGRPDMALFKFTKGILNNKKIDIYNNGKNLRDFTYIDDVSKILIKSINKKIYNKTLNICRSNPILTNKLIQLLILNYSNKKKIKLKKIDFVEGEVLKTHGSNKNLKKIFKNLIFTDIKKGIKNTVKSFKINNA